MTLRPSTTSLSCTGALIPWLIIIEWRWDKTYMMYSAEGRLYCSAQPLVFSHIKLNFDIGFFNNSIKWLLCAVVVAASCFLLSDKDNEKLHVVDMVLWISYFCLWKFTEMFQYNTLNIHGSISTIMFWFYYVEKLETTLSA